MAAKYPTFPILLETTRECLQDVFDVPALREVLGRPARSRGSAWSPSTPHQASPFAQSLLFGWIAVYMYEGDAPLAERRAAALALDRDLLRELLGAEELRELLDPDVLADLELELQCLAEGRRARNADELHDLLRKVGDLTAAEVASCGAISDRASWLNALLAGTPGHPRARSAGEERLAAAEDAARLRDALGVTMPSGCRRRSPSPSSGRSRGWSPATPAPTARSTPTMPPAASASRARASPMRSHARG